MQRRLIQSYITSPHNWHCVYVKRTVFLPSRYDPHHVVGRAAHQTAQLFQRDHGDVPVLSQGIQRLVVDAVLQQVVLGYAIFAHGFPQRTVIKNGVHPRCIADSFI